MSEARVERKVEGPGGDGKQVRRRPEEEEGRSKVSRKPRGQDTRSAVCEKAINVHSPHLGTEVHLGGKRPRRPSSGEPGPLCTGNKTRAPSPAELCGRRQGGLTSRSQLSLRSFFHCSLLAK